MKVKMMQVGPIGTNCYILEHDKKIAVIDPGDEGVRILAELGKMEGQVDPETAGHRVELLLDLQSRIMDQWNESQLGRTLEVLCEGFDSQAGLWAGRSYADSAEVDGRVLFTSPEPVEAGRFVWVRITGSAGGELTGQILE